MVLAACFFGRCCGACLASRWSAQVVFAVFDVPVFQHLLASAWTSTHFDGESSRYDERAPSANVASRIGGCRNEQVIVLRFTYCGHNS